MANTQNCSSGEQVGITVNNPGKLVYFSDGVQEEVALEETTEVDSAPPAEENVDPKTLSWGPWFSHYATKSGTKVLNAVDYVGEGLADFFGITTPKYHFEIEEHKRIKAEQEKLERDSVGWVPKNGGGDVPLVIQEPAGIFERPLPSK